MTAHSSVLPVRFFRRALCTFAAVGALVFLACASAAVSKPAPHEMGVPAVGTFARTLARAPGPAREWRTVLDRYGRFMVSLPDDWLDQGPESRGDNCNLVACDRIPRDGFVANLLVSQQNAPEGYRLKPKDVQVTAARQEHDNKQYGYKALDRAFLQINKVPYVVVGGTVTVDGRKSRNIQVNAVHRGVYYTFTFTSLERYYPQYEPLFARVVKSIVFERPDGTWPTPQYNASPVPSPSPSPLPRPAPSASPAPLPAGLPSAAPAR